MTVRLQNTDRWTRLRPGEGLGLRGSGPRKVRVELNCPMPTRVDLVEGDPQDADALAAAFFLGGFVGLETVEFTVTGENSVLVFTSDDDVWFYAEEPDGYSENLEAVSFATIAQRRARNPELERMMWKLEENMTRRLEKQAAELAAWRDAHPQTDPETGEDTSGDDAANGDATGVSGASGDGGAATGGADAESQGAADGAAA